MRLKVFLQVVLFLFPWKLRRPLLNFCFHYNINKNARIGLSIILAKQLVMEKKSRIHNFTVCKGIDRLVLKEDSGIASWNLITGFSQDAEIFEHVAGRQCELVLNEHSGITMRHYIDCNGGIYIGAYTTIAGTGSQILTHSIDIYANRQDAKPVYIGRYCFIGTKCILLPGSKLPDYSVLAAGSVLNKPYQDECFLYAGVPARATKKLQKENVKYFYREKHYVD
jgi:acetyltransferase-like isoleucine patch superfamily enzyme